MKKLVALLLIVGAWFMLVPPVAEAAPVAKAAPVAMTEAEMAVVEGEWWWRNPPPPPSPEADARNLAEWADEHNAALAAEPVPLSHRMVNFWHSHVAPLILEVLVAVITPPAAVPLPSMTVTETGQLKPYGIGDFYRDVLRGGN